MTVPSTKAPPIGEPATGRTPHEHQAAGIPRYRPFHGPALLRQGFRPFFLGAGVWALAAMLLWIGALQGYLTLPTAFDPVGWHAHEMIFGFVAAAVAGFLLTAIPNWTGRMPLQGIPLGLLFAVWLAGRLAVCGSAWIGAAVAAALDLSFLGLLLGVVLREILAGRNWRNLPMPIALGGLLAANALTHADAVGIAATGPLGQRLGIGIAILLIGLIGGRVIPSFTQNWLKKRGDTRLPARFGALDRMALGVAVRRLGGLGGRARRPDHRRSPDRRRHRDPDPSRALARPTHPGRASGLEPASGLRLGGGGPPARRPRHIPAGGAAGGRSACADRRRDGRHDPGGDDAGDAWATPAGRGSGPVDGRRSTSSLPPRRALRVAAPFSAGALPAVALGLRAGMDRSPSGSSPCTTAGCCFPAEIDHGCSCLF